MMLDQKTIDAMVGAASEALKHAYAPYSGKPQGAALLTAGGDIICGATLEFATYGGSISADTAALVNAANLGHRQFQALCLQPFDWPSGVTRQFYAEFGVEVSLLVPEKGESGHYKLVSWPELLPHHFGPKNLDQAKTKQEQ